MGPTSANNLPPSEGPGQLWCERWGGVLRPRWGDSRRRDRRRSAPATPARVAARQLISGPNIYSAATVTRQIYILRATVRPGNSGGPLLAPDGKVYGVVFAASTIDPATGYALTAGQIRSDARAGASAVRPVATRGCT